MAQSAKNPPAMQETRVQSLGWEDLLEKEMATHSSILAWEIPRTEGVTTERLTLHTLNFFYLLKDLFFWDKQFPRRTSLTDFGTECVCPAQPIFSKAISVTPRGERFGADS